MDMAVARAKLDTSGGAASLELRQHCQRRRTAMRQMRQEWMADWEDVSRHIDPARGRFNESSTQDRPNKRSRAKIINGTGAKCVRVAVSGMSSHMTSKARPWFQLSTPDPALSELFDVRVWLDDVTQILRDILAKSNFYKAMPVVYGEDLMFGVAVMMIAENAEEVARFHPLTAGTYAIALDSDGKVDSLWRTYRRSARQLKQKYGKDDGNGDKSVDHLATKLPTSVLTACKNNPDAMFTVEALIEPNPDAEEGYGPLRVQSKERRPWREVTWISGSENDKHGVLEVGGHYEAPFVAIRINPVGDDVYSTSPGIDSLGDIKQLQYLEGQKLMLIDLSAEPPLGLPDGMNGRKASLAPRSKTYLPNSQVGAKAEVLYRPEPMAINYVTAEIREVESRIKDTFYYNLFLMMESLGDQTGRTATEIAERKEEKASVLGPTLESVTDEGLEPTIVRVYRLAERAGKIPEAPEALAGVPLKIEYTSILAQAMKAAGTMGIERAVAFVAQLAAATADPSKFDKLDTDQAIDEYTERAGAPAVIIRDDEAVDAIRKGRAAMQQRQQMMAAAKPLADAAKAVKTLDEAVPQEGSLGEQLAEQMRGGVAA